MQDDTFYPANLESGLYLTWNGQKAQVRTRFKILNRGFLFTVVCCFCLAAQICFPQIQLVSRHRSKIVTKQCKLILNAFIFRYLCKWIQEFCFWEKGFRVCRNYEPKPVLPSIQNRKVQMKLFCLRLTIGVDVQSNQSPLPPCTMRIICKN